MNAFVHYNWSCLFIILCNIAPLQLRVDPQFSKAINFIK